MSDPKPFHVWTDEQIEAVAAMAYRYATAGDMSTSGAVRRALRETRLDHAFRATFSVYAPTSGAAMDAVGDALTAKGIKFERLGILPE